MSKFNKTILAVAAHPDDVEISFSGTLKLMADRGYKIAVATVTAGQMGSYEHDVQTLSEMRQDEARKAAQVLNAEYYCLEQMDGFVMDSMDARLKMAELIRQVQPGIIITHLNSDYHSDHRMTSVITEAAAMVSTLPNVPSDAPPLPITPLLYYSAPFGLKTLLGDPLPRPHFYVDITSSIDTKMEMLKHHQTQIDLMRGMHRIDDFFGEMKRFSELLGKDVNVPYAEAYYQHLGGGYQHDPLIQEELKGFVLTKND